MNDIQKPNIKRRRQAKSTLIAALAAVSLLLFVVLTACSAETDRAESPDVGSPPANLSMVAGSWATDWEKTTIDLAELISGGVTRDGIPSINDPAHESTDNAAQWLVDTEPVIVLDIEGDARAYPLSILTRHEIVNDTVGGVPVAVTFCPLCNSALVFDRRVNGDIYEFGVSGLLRNSDLVMYDRSTESLWQQFTGEGIVGEHAGDVLAIVPSSIVSFADFIETHPDGRVLSTGGRTYGRNPYTYYDSGTGKPFLFFGEPDDRLPLMLRVVGFTTGDRTVAYPYDVLSRERAVNDTVGGQDIVIFFRFGTSSALDSPIIAEGRDVGAATVFDPTLDGEKLTFFFDGEHFVDEQTNSTWTLLGKATGGPLTERELIPLAHSDHFWFSWAAFYPDTSIYPGR
jgi:hypothetical protein